MTTSEARVEPGRSGDTAASTVPRALALLLAAVVAQSAAAAPPPDPQAVALASLEAAATQPVRIHFDAGFPVVIRADVDLSGADAEARANSLLTGFPDLFRQSDPELALQLRGVLQDGADEIVSFTQSYAGLPVFDSVLTIVNREPSSPTAPWKLGGAVGRLIVDGIIPLALDVVPAVSAANAEDAARTFLARPGAPVLAETTLGIIDPEMYDITGPTRLAWRVTLGGGASHRLYIDAHTLAVDFEHTLVNEAYADFDFDLEDSNGGNLVDTNCFNPTTIDDQIGDEDGIDDPWSSYSNPTVALGATRDTVDFYFDALGRRSWDNDDGEVYAYVYSVYTNGNARYVAGCEAMEFVDDFIGWDVVAHEFTHGVIRHSLSNLIYKNQSGALNESYADTMANFVDPSEDWLVGEDTLNGNGPIRSMKDPSGPDCTPAGTNCGDPDTMGAYDPTTADNGGVHTNSGIPNKAHYLISEGGLHNGVTVAGLGNVKAQRLIYLVLQILPASADFEMAANWTSALAENWAESGKNGFTAANACDVRQAWAAVEILDPDFNCDGVPDSIDDPDGDRIVSAEDNCPNDPNPGQADTNKDGIGDVCDDDSDNDGWSDSIDNCPDDFQPGYANVDLDGDGLGNGCDDDDDGDGALDGADNCPETPNPSQADSCGTSLGDACDFDHDADGDGLCLSQDNCPFVPNPTTFPFPQADADGDGIGDACDACANVADNTNAYTPGIPELGVDPAPYQPDTDGDGTPDACDTLAFGGAGLVVAGSPWNPADPITGHFFPFSIQVTGSPGDVIEVALPVCPSVGRANPGSDDRVELVFTGLENAITVAILDESGAAVTSSNEPVPAGRGLRFRPDCIHEYRLRLRIGAGFSGSNTATLGIDDVVATTSNPWAATPSLGFPPLALPDDTDSDGLWDLIDRCPLDADPSNRDTDLDGNGNVCDADDDGDGLADTVETDTGVFVDANDTGSNPLLADSDGDGVDDGVEVQAGTDPGDPLSFPAPNLPLLGSTGLGLLIAMLAALGAVAAGSRSKDGRCTTAR